MQMYNIDNSDYFKLRDLGKMFNISIEYDSATDTIIIDTKKDYKE